MRIGFDFVQPSAALAGCGWYAHSLLTEMARLAPEQEFLAYRHFGQWFMPLEKLCPLPARPNISDPLAALPKDTIIRSWQEGLAQGNAPGRPDLVHSTSFQSPRLASSKLVVTIYDLSFWALPAYTTDNIRLGCQAGVLDALAHADGLIFISEHARSEFNAFLPDYLRREQIASIVTPLAARWPVETRAPTGSGTYWLFVGSLEPRKNLETLLVAYAAYIRDHPAPKPLWLAGGSGWQNESILALLRPLEHRGLVRRLGFVPDEQLPGLYREAQALVFPSWYEGFGLPVLEAMTQHCPVICSDRTSLPEIAGEAAHYVDPSSPEQIVQAMRRLEQDPVYRDELASRGCAQAGRFSWEKTAKQTLAFYEQVLSTA